MARELIASDLFNRASLGADWSQLASASQGDVIIDASTRVSGGNGGEDVALWVGAGAFADDQYSSLELVTFDLFSGGRMGVIARASADTDAGRDYYLFEIEDNAAVGQPKLTHLVSMVNGARTALVAASTVAWAAGDRIEIECEGTTIRGMRNGVLVSGFSATDTSLASGKPGVRTQAGYLGDNWQGGDITAGTSGTGSTSGATVTASGPTAVGLGFSLVTMASPFDFGPGSIFYPPNWQGSPPANGDTVRYPNVDGLVVFPDGSARADVLGQWQCFYNDSGGEDPFTLTINDTAYALTAGATVSVSGPSVSGSGGGAGIGITTGAGVEVSGPTASGAGAATAPTSGATLTSSGPTTAGAGGAQAATTGETVEVSGPDATGVGGSAGTGVTSGETVEVSGPVVSGGGAAQATTAGESVEVSGPAASGTGAASAPTSGETVEVSGPVVSGGGAAQATTAGESVEVSGPDAAAVGHTTAITAGATVGVSGPDVGPLAGAVASSSGASMTIVSGKIAAGEIVSSVYAQRQDMIARFGETELLQLTDRYNQGAIDEIVLSQALFDADAEINPYIEGRYPLPLTSVPRILISYACDLARYRLYDDRATEQVTKRYDRAIKFLECVAKGVVTLGLNRADEPIAPANSASADAAPRVFTRQSLSDFTGG